VAKLLNSKVITQREGEGAIVLTDRLERGQGRHNPKGESSLGESGTSRMWGKSNKKRIAGKLSKERI